MLTYQFVHSDNSALNIFSVPTFVSGTQKPQAGALVPQSAQSGSGGQVRPGADQPVGHLGVTVEGSVNSEAWRGACWGSSGPLVKGKDLS